MPPTQITLDPPTQAAASGAAVAGARHFGVDWLRIGAFHLLILYHIGMVFVPWEWHVSADAPVAWAVLPMVAINAWRLTLLFTVSGFASAAMLARRRDLAGFARNRAMRLGLPLLFGMLLITPVQPWIQLSTQRGYAHDFAWFYTHDYFRFGRLGGMVLPAWQHLWFVVYLLAYTAILLLLLALPARLRHAARAAAERLAPPLLLLLLPIIVAIPLRLFWLSSAEDNHDFAGDWVAHIRHLPAFLFGYLLYGSAPLWRAVRRDWLVSGLLALASTVAVVWIVRDYPATRPISTGMRQIYQICRIVQGWATILALLAMADRWWNHDHRWRATLAEAVFPFYLIHQTIIIVVGWLLLGTATSNGARLAILVLATLGGCWIFYLVGRRLGPLRPLIGLRGLPATTGTQEART